MAPHARGVLVGWRAGLRHVQLFCMPSPEKTYIYEGEINQNTARDRIVEEVSRAVLRQSLRWMQQTD